ncbi:hypothetical protein ACFQE5_22075 [Pseudonocardia hispaniensis]|uniref:Uncharacterized protein n=1 Tax=Pseudonocardia hispaniensis TaxID=904933 RepID=A0ABW1J809_9PSEU
MTAHLCLDLRPHPAHQTTGPRHRLHARPRPVHDSLAWLVALAIAITHSTPRWAARTLMFTAGVLAGSSTVAVALLLAVGVPR